MKTSKHGELGSGGGGEGSGQYRYIRMNFNLEKCILHGKMFLLHTQCHSYSSKTHTGALDGMESHPGRYAELLDKSERVKCLPFEEIERDLHR